MGLFRRGESARATEDAAQDEQGTPSPGEEPLDAPDEAEAPADAATHDRGPWDAAEVDGIGNRVDLGAVWLPGVPGMELRMELDKATEVVSAAAVSLDGSVLQVQAFAAPRTEGIWDEIRAEIAESVVKQGGSADDLPGPFGRELLARLPVRTPEGRTGHRPARFLGTDGPRWFLRGVLTGKAAVDPEAAVALEGVFADIVVVRGTEARAPRDLLPLRLPGSAAPSPVAQKPSPELEVLTRGPEITETR